MSSDPPNASRSPAPDPASADPALAALVRERGEPLLEGLEAHLPGSRQHAEATGAYAFAVAVALNLGRAGAELFRETARLHDVGLLYVPAAVMGTPFESWDADQRTVFDAHYEAGAKLALGAGVPDDVCGWLLQIRERFDGAGPDRLAGDAIPIAARVIRAACACDTLLASPASGESLEARRRDTVERLRSAAGADLDPKVVEVVVAALSDTGG
jgi:HD-GYP domain-containing protein (c-di-GMP phosphodiesterase class II)